MEYRQKPLAGNWLARLPRSRKDALSIAQRQMYSPSSSSAPGSRRSPTRLSRYARESLVNFRWISRVCATRSPHPLTTADRVDADVALTLSDIGQFAELAYTPVPLPYVFENLHALSRHLFPLEGYDSLRDAVLVYHTHGKIADVQAFVAYRPKSRQLVAAFCGTSNLSQCLYDLRLSRHHYHNGTARRGRVHSGFWWMFKGLRLAIMRAIEAACSSRDVDELVLTGHSLGGALAYLFALEALSSEYALPRGLRIVVTTFGAPRVGDAELAAYWNELTDAYRSAHGASALQEFCVKGFRDGVPAIPPSALGYRHLCREPLYFVHGRLYRVPESEREHSLFDVEPAEDDAPPPLHPRGGHNYYNGRNMESAFRRLQFLAKIIESRIEGWEDRYLRRVHRYEGLALDKMRALSEPPAENGDSNDSSPSRSDSPNPSPPAPTRSARSLP